jgi:hypothetical protein
VSASIAVEYDRLWPCWIRRHVDDHLSGGLSRPNQSIVAPHGEDQLGLISGYWWVGQNGKSDVRRTSLWRGATTRRRCWRRAARDQPRQR